MLDEKFITCKLIDFLEGSFKFDFLAREVPFSSGRRRADMVAASKIEQSTYAFEIKGDNDTLIRLDGQLNDYKLTFNYVFVVTTKKYLNQVKKMGRWYGLMLINSDGHIDIVRHPRRRSLSKVQNGRPQLITDVVSDDFNNHYIDWLCNRYEPLYELFKKERTSGQTSVIDIGILSLRSDVVQLF